MDKQTRIDTYVSRLLMVCFFLPDHVQTFVVIGVGAYFGFRTFASGPLPPRSNYMWAVLLGSMYLLYAGSLALTPDIYMARLGHALERKASLFALPVAFAIITPAFGRIIMSEIVFFAYACAASCLMGNLGFVYHHFFTSDIPTLSHVAYRLGFEALTGLHPTYISMYIAFSICIMLSPAAAAVRPALRYLIIGALLLFMLALLAKTPIIALILILMYQAWARRRELVRYRLPIAISMAAVIAACFFIPFIGQRIGEVFSFFGHGKATNVADNSMHVRALIWDIDTSLLKHYWLTGIGPGQMLYRLHDHYFIYSLLHNFNVGFYDPHNEYFYEWLCFGITGIVLFVIIMAAHISRARRSQNPLYGSLLFILYLTFTTESVLARQQGVIFYATFTSLFFFLAQKNKQTNSLGE